MKTVDGRLYVIAGASRSGKTWWASKEAARHRRVIAWDPEDQWGQLRGWRRVTTRKELLRIVSTIKGPLRVAYVAGGALREEFEFFCGCAYYWGRYLGPCATVAEELADVSTPSKAPEKWGIMLRRGLKRGITIYAISQRWAEADKTAIGNASAFVIFRTVGDDTAYMARKSSAPLEELRALPPRQFVIVDAATGAITRGKLR